MSRKRDGQSPYINFVKYSPVQNTSFGIFNKVIAVQTHLMEQKRTRGAAEVCCSLLVSERLKTHTLTKWLKREENWRPCSASLPPSLPQRSTPPPPRSKWWETDLLTPHNRTESGLYMWTAAKDTHSCRCVKGAACGPPSCQVVKMCQCENQKRKEE